MTDMNPMDKRMKPVSVRISPRMVGGVDGSWYGRMSSHFGVSTTRMVTNRPPISVTMPKITVKKARISL